MWGEAFYSWVHMHPLFENIKKLKQKYFVYMSMFYVPTKLFQHKSTFYMIYVKMIKFDTPSNPYYSSLIQMYV
jgi:hypothetical protein